MCHINDGVEGLDETTTSQSVTVTSRPELYAGLLPLTILSLFLYYRVLLKIYISRKILAYSSFFYKMTWSLAIYDISYVILYFVVEIPQGWQELYGFYHSLNCTVFPQLHWAHQWMSYLAEFSGITLMSISRMLALCYPEGKLSRFVFFFQPPRHYDYHPVALSITRLGDEYSIKFNSNVTIVTSTGGALISAMCYFRIFLALRKRPYRSWNQEVSVIITSFVLFLSLCLMCAYYVVYKYSLISENYDLFFTLRHYTFIVTFFIALVNPWCLMITNDGRIARPHCPSPSPRQNAAATFALQLSAVYFNPSLIKHIRSAPRAQFFRLPLCMRIHSKEPEAHSQRRPETTLRLLSDSLHSLTRYSSYIYFICYYKYCRTSAVDKLLLVRCI
ncbi:hypothetical protein PRIPAC_92430 [Pristionchus pacificus]|uniref:G protein-coupled receptor n=1 Tax=Pristionchus pacificus TaxID=54126 RepID=A0A2A6BAC3_PRIPA|nr:hypothetical protein PRIPAC_92430 [Pristionchus pacificus]|eukprot:PDM62832.1 G protein-coupled receptor [Pristionchus pacificus]